MLPELRVVGHCLRMLVLALVAAPAFAQVPQDTTFTGRLVDGAGAPLIGPVDLELRIFDAETAGTQLYSEQHLGTSLDPTGGFSVQLGLGTSPSGTFDAALFSGTNRWLEVVVGVDVLTPRQIIGSVPWALIAQQANEIVPSPNAPRFEDCGDGTVADHQTGLQWEKKTGTVGSQVVCETAGCPDLHDVNNVYEWSNTGSDVDGNAFTDFLARLNSDLTLIGPTTSEQAHGDPSDDPAVCFAYHCDWRIAALGELRTILIGPGAAPGQATTCSAPCIDPDFAAVGGPTAPGWYWSASTFTAPASYGWFADFQDGDLSIVDKGADLYARAVRAGSCH